VTCFLTPVCAALMVFLLASHEEPPQWLSTPQQRQERLEQHDERKARHLPSEKYNLPLIAPPTRLTPPADALCRKICRQSPRSEACETCR
jgi:hypothetical protein